MRLPCRLLISAGLLLVAVPSFALARPRTLSSKRHYRASLKHTSLRHERRSHMGEHHQPAALEMPTERATQIQTALIQKGYMTGEPSGVWDAQTISAMQKLQEDNGWQRKITPDSRALIKLGLGPEAPSPGTGIGAVPSQPQTVAQIPQQ